MEEEEFRSRKAVEESKEHDAGEEKEAEHKGLTTLA